MNQEDFNKKAIEIIKTNIYLTLATTDGDLPWVAPLFYCLDENYNIYFTSQIDSLHVVHILKQPKISFSVFDSHQKEGEGNGIQATGTVSLLKDNEIIEGLKYYSTSFMELSPEFLCEPASYRLFKLKIDKVFILDPEAKTDKRVEVKLDII